MSYNKYPWYYDANTAPKHCHGIHRNQTLMWLNGDSESEFAEKLKNPDTRNMLERFGWMDPIEYSFNNLGFRSKPFDDRPAGLALGCSFTSGVGLRLEQVWPSLLTKMLGTHIWNLGIPGAASDTVFRILDFYLSKFNPKFVCVLLPPADRFEYANIQKHYTIIQAESLGPHPQFAKEWLVKEENGIRNTRKNLLAIKQLCHEANIPVYCEDSIEGWAVEDKDYARDLLHYGSKSQQVLANKFYNQMKEHHGI